MWTNSDCLRSRWSQIFCLALDCSRGQAADELFAKEGEHEEDRDDGKRRRAAERTPLLPEEADVVPEDAPEEELELPDGLVLPEAEEELLSG